LTQENHQGRRKEVRERERNLSWLGYKRSLQGKLGGKTVIGCRGLKKGRGVKGFSKGRGKKQSGGDAERPEAKTNKRTDGKKGTVPQAVGFFKTQEGGGERRRGKKNRKKKERIDHSKSSI